MRSTRCLSLSCHDQPIANFISEALAGNPDAALPPLSRLFLRATGIRHFQRLTTTEDLELYQTLGHLAVAATGPLGRDFNVTGSLLTIGPGPALTDERILRYADFKRDRVIVYTGWDPEIVFTYARAADEDGKLTCLAANLFRGAGESFVDLRDVVEATNAPAHPHERTGKSAKPNEVLYIGG